MVDFLADDSVLLVLAVIGVGAGLGAVRFRGVAVGPAAALFVGLAVGAVDESLSGASGLVVLRELGLVLFAYTVGLASGPVFLDAVRRRGLRTLGVVVALTAVLAVLCWGAAEVLDLGDADRAGLFAGATTNTPALQTASELVRDGDPVVAYSVAYPAAVASMLVMLTLLVGRRLPLGPGTAGGTAEPSEAPIVNWTLDVISAASPSLDELRARHPGVAFSRVEHDGVVDVATGERRPARGDRLVVIGPEASVAALCEELGRRSDRHLPLDRATLDFRRIGVSNRRLAGRRLGDLDLPHRHGVAVSRIRRGDHDHVATDDFVLQLGDRVRVVGPSSRLGEVARYLGDSERRLAEVDALGFATGAALGLVLGALRVPAPGVVLELGPGAGPLVAGLVLGVVSRTGPVTWQIPHGANLVIRQLGLAMFLACAGLGSGTAFADAIGTRHGLRLVAAGVVVAAAFAALVPLALHLVARSGAAETAGMLAGVETQPAALAYATDRTQGDDRVIAGYALVFPVAMVAKVLVVQLLA